MSLWSLANKAMPNPFCLSYEAQVTLQDFAFALLKAGNSRAARIAIIAITTRSSINVNAFSSLDWFVR